MQEMQRLQQQMQAQMAQRQQQGHHQIQHQIHSNGNLSNIPQIQQLQSQGYGNQQWMDPSQQQCLGGVQQHRNSLSGMSNSMAMMQQQHHVNQSIGTPNGNSHNPFYWNALQGNKGLNGGMGVGMDSSVNKSSSLATMAGMNMGGNSSQMGILDNNSMQALLQQQGGAMPMGNNQQQQMLSMGQQQLGNKDMSSTMGSMNASLMMGGQSAHQMQMLQKIGNSSSSLLGGSSGRSDISSQGQQLHSSSSGNSNAQLLLQQQSVIADLKRQLQAQQAGGADRRSSSSMMSSQQQQQQQLLQQMQQRGSANSAMLHQMTSGIMSDSSSRAQLLQRQPSNSSLGGSSKPRQSPMGQNEPITMAQLMGHQGGQQSNMSQAVAHMGMSNAGSSRLSGTQHQSNPASLLSGGIFDNSNGSSNQQSLLMQQQQQQQLQLQQITKNGMDSLSGMGQSSRAGSINEHILAQQQQLMSTSGMSQANMQKAQQLLMHQSMGMGQSMQSMNQSIQPLGQALSRSNSQSLGNASSGGMTQPLTNAADPLMDGLKGAPEASSGSNHEADSDDEKSSVGLEELGISSGKGRGGSQLNRPNVEKTKEDTGPSFQSFLDGTFAGGWQTNNDIPDRRRVIYNICKVIEQMRPDASKMSQK